MGRAQILADFLRLHHGGAALGKRGFLARLRGEAAELFDGVAQPFGLARRALDGGAVLGDGRFALAPLGPQPRHFGGVVLDAAIGVEQRAMGRGIDEGAVVVLAVDFDQSRRRARAAPAR